MSVASIKLLDRARPEILALQPYSSARMEAPGTASNTAVARGATPTPPPLRSWGGQEEGARAAIMLNANESPWAPVGSADSLLNRYPDPQPPILRMRLAKLYDVVSEQVLIGRGSDEAIDLIVRAFCHEGRDAVVISPPTFGMYAVAARTQGAEVIEVALTGDFQVDVGALLARVTEYTKLVFVCTPNNPTGAIVPLKAIERLARELRDKVLIVVDEAYFEFSQAAASATSLLPRHDNIAVLRTLSKAYALAGARVGTLIAHPEIVALLRRIQAPYPLPTSCVDAALAALTPAAIEESRARITTLLRERDRLAKALPAAANVVAIYPSSANFLCVRFVDSTRVYKNLLDLGIVVRDVSRYPGLSDCLRITIGTPQENTKLLAALGLREAVA
jgi:histidinol-phosphate aminotransferase